MSSPPKVFISYSQDSPEHAERVRALADRLCGDGVDCTIDQYEPHPKEPWPRWMDRQIEEADFVLVVCTETYLRRAEGREKPGSGLGVTFESVLIVQDLYDAGMRNEKFIPVLFEGASPLSIPKPLRGYTRYRADTEDGYESLLRHLRNEPRVRKPEIKPGRPLPPVPSPAPSSRYRSMAQPLEAFIHRQEYEEILEVLCPAAGVVQSASMGITIALRGAGGCGKTYLAQAICQDSRVRQTYPNGILWATMGEDIDANGRLARVRDLIRWWTREEAPAFETVTAAGARLRELLIGSQVLIVIDDVWNSADVTAFQGLSAGSALLITTRDSQTLPVDSKRVEVDAMEPSEAVSLLGLGLPDGFSKEIQALAARLGEWPLLLKLINRQLQELVKEDGLPVPKALREIEEALLSEGFSAFDRADQDSLHAAASRAILVSTLQLTEFERECYFKLAVFVPNVDIPISTIERFWELSHFQARRLCRRLADFSLLEFGRGTILQLGSDTIRLDDIIHTILTERIAESLPSLHDHLLSIFIPPSKLWADLPTEDVYLWRNISRHFMGAGRQDEFSNLLLNISFIKAKLKAVGIDTFLADYGYFVDELSPIYDALSLFNHITTTEGENLVSRIVERILGAEIHATKDMSLEANRQIGAFTDSSEDRKSHGLPHPPSIFVSYSHKDELWRERLIVHLSVLEREQTLTIWNDRNIEAGSEWLRAINEAIDSSSLAILMISANFLTSEFIRSQELPRLLKRRKEEGMVIFPIIISSCVWRRVEWLSDLQARPLDGRPLSSYRGDRVDAEVAKIVEEVADILNL